MLCWNDSPAGLKRCERLVEALELTAICHPVIALVGGGGKTSTIERLAREYAAGGNRVIITTTTHIRWPEEHIASADDREEILRQLERYPILTVGTPDPEEGYTSVSDAQVRALRELCDVVLVEADGSRMLPMKCPADHEPVIPDCASVVVGVAGLNALGAPLSQKCHRWHLAAALLGMGEDDSIELHHIAKMLSSPQGQKKNVRCEYRVLLNQADDQSRLKNGQRIASCLRDYGVQSCCIAALKKIA